VEEQLRLSYFFYENEEQPDGVAATINAFLEQLSQLDNKQQEDQYETDAGHASESDDEYSDTDTASEEAAVHSLGKRTLLKRCPTPPRPCDNMSTSSSSASWEDK